MYFKKSLFPIVFLFFSSAYKAQLKFKHLPSLFYSTTSNVPTTFSLIESGLKAQQTPRFMSGLKIEMPKLAFFCGIEEKCRKHLGIFIKLRTGNDEAYRTMINANN
jgi:hypothetical protein